MMVFLLGMVNLSHLRAQRQFSPIAIREVQDQYQLGLIDTFGDVGLNTATNEILVGFGYAIERDAQGYITKMSRFVVGDGDYLATGVKNGSQYEVTINTRLPNEEGLNLKAKEIWYNNGLYDTLVVISRYDTSSKTLIAYQREQYDYFPDGRMRNLKFSSSVDSGNTWKLAREAQYVYDAQNRIDSIKNYYLDQTVNYFTMQRFYKVFRTGNKIDSMYFYFGSELTGIYEPRFKDISQEWYPDGRVKMYTSYRKDPGATDISRFNGGRWFNQTRFKNWTSLGEVKELNAHIYPQPASSKLWIDGLPQGKSYQYQMYNLKGEKLGSGYFENQGQINTSELPDGMYLLQVIDLDKSAAFSRKIIKITE